MPRKMMCIKHIQQFNNLLKVVTAVFTRITINVTNSQVQFNTIER